MSHTLKGIPHLTTEQKRTLVERLLREKAEVTREGAASLPDRFEAQVDRCPEAIAITFEEERATYRELDRRSNQLAHRLRRLGVGPEVRVGLCVRRSIAMVVGVLGVLKAGGAYVPLDPDFPADRLGMMLEDSRVAVLVTEEPLKSGLAVPTGTVVVCLDSDRAGIERESERRLGGRPAGENLAYVIYTSGSTGRPKGVMVTHRALANLLQSFRALLGMTERDELAAVTTLSFDIAGLELFLPLVVGGRLALVGRDEASDGSRLMQRLSGGCVTFLQATPATWRLLLEAGWEGSAALTLLCGGEALPRVLADRLLERGKALWNLYGPTETTIWSSAERVEPGDGPVSIGRPIARTRMYVLDSRLQPVPVGVVGELYIAGTGLARGYLNRPGPTSERFLPDPFGDEPGGRLYRTGDLARWLPDGRLECLGRVDHQVKIRGYRIELGEIEATLAKHPAVHQAAVVAREDVPGDRRLVAYLVGEAPAAAELRTWLLRSLPEYMVPSVYHVLDALPVTPNGKVDRNALPAPEPGQSGIEQALVPPRGPIEEAVAAIWAEVLVEPQSRIGIYESFFELGGHSLLAAQLLSRLRDLFSVDLPLRSLFADPTVAGVARWIEEGRRGGVGLELPPLLRADRPEEIPPSFAQQSLWFLDQLSPGQATFNMTVAGRVTGPFDVVAFERSLAEIVRRHESLRTYFASVDGRPVQVVAEEVALPLVTVDLRALGEAEREAEARWLATEEARLPFDLAVGPLVRAEVIQFGDLDHAILLSLHHIIGDGWSFGVAASELATLYDAYHRGVESPLAPLPVQYADYSLWQRSWLEGALRKRLVEYWSRQLAGVTPLELPTDRPRPPIRTSRGAFQPLTIPATVAEPLVALCRREGVTPFMLLLAAFQTLLHRWSGQDDIVVGSPVANRSRSEVEGLIGYFVNMLALRTDLSGDPSFRTLLGRVREVALGAYEHQDLPFEMVVEALQPSRDPSRTPLFQAMFVLQNNWLPDVGRSRLKLAPLALDSGTGTAKFDLTLMLEETRDGLHGGLEYNTDLFDATTIARMLGHFATLLESIAADPDRRLTELPWLDDRERSLVLQTWSKASAVGFDGDTARDVTGIHDLFEAQVDRCPEAIAITFEEERATYRELDRRSNQLAHRLRRLGVGPEVRVGLCVRRSIAMVVGVLGVLKAGGAYVPLDPDFPADRLGMMLEDSRVAVLVTEEPLKSGLAVPTGTVVVCLDSDRAGIERESERRLGGRPAGENLAYVIYTSGSTGRPKGVMVTHRALANLLQSFRALLGMTERDELAAVTTLSFDIAGLELFLPLLVGGRLALVGRDEASDGTRLMQRLSGGDVSFLQATPATWRLLLEAGWEGSAALTLLCGGEALPRVLADRLLERGKALWNLYGPTETTIWSSAERVEPGDGPVSIGRPIARTRMYVLDSRLQPVPVGVVGELYIAGTGLARGYLNRPGPTSERFLPDPFGDEPGGRLYRTGDLARWLPDGRLECLGRVDHQVKIRGYRIELGEIEATLAKHPAVREAAVVAREDVPGDRRLVAYLVGEAPAAAELRTWLLRSLPEYMVPSVYHVLDALPLTPNGKVDRNALPAPEPGQSGIDQALVPPRGPIEEAVAAIWAEVLVQPQSRIGIYESFFELGGHSLLAAQLLSRLRDLFSVDLPLRSLFADPTVAGVARWIEEGRRGGAGLELPPLLRADRPAEIPPSFAQQSLWFLDQLSPGQATFNMTVAGRVTGPFDVVAFERSLAEIVRRHESLRTYFASVDGRPVQVVAEEVALPLVTVDLRALGEAEREAEARRLATEEARLPFDLAVGPLVRAQVIQFGDLDHAILLSLHHIIGDGWSFGVAASELATLYDAYHRGVESPLAPLPVQYADYSLWQRSWLEGALRKRLVEYWSRQLAGVTPLELPTDRPRPPIRTSRGAFQPLTIPATVAEPLVALCRREGVTPFMLLLAAFQTLLHRWSGQDDIVVGSPVANRSRSEVEGLIGYFVNMLALRTDLSGDPSFRTLLGRVREVALGAYEHQELPFEMVVEALQPSRDASRTPLFQVMFVLQNNRLPDVGRSELKLSPLTLDSGTGTAKFDITLVLEESKEELHGGLEYNTDLFDATTIARMLGHFATLLTSIAADPDRRLTELPWLDDQERSLVLESWSTTSAVNFDTEPARDSVRIHHLFEAQVERTPDALALDFGAQRATYRELNARANRLAHYLAGVGVGPESVVAICVGRSPEMLAGVLGVLKAGGAYLPLDPESPAEQRALVLADARVDIVLTQEQLRLQLPPGDATVVTFEQVDSSGEETTGDPALDLMSDSLAYVVYTSGSTGRPKGVMVEHASLVAAARAWKQWYALGPGLRHLQAAGFGFDVFTGDWVRALTTGGTLVSCPRAALLDPAMLTAILGDNQIDCVELVPAVAEALASELERTGCTLEPLQLLVVGSDTLQSDLFARLQCLVGPSGRVLNSYGLTEATIDSTFYEEESAKPAPGKGGAAPIGRPFGPTRVYVLDGSLEPLPVGVAGELYIGGSGVARGYRNRPGPTAARFLPDPFGTLGRRLYRTGDRGRWRQDGVLELLGRTDRQVKIRGYRIELGEVEATLHRHPAVREAAVEAHEDSRGNARLLAYVVPRPGAELVTLELRHWLQAKLPAPMVPAAFVRLESLPVSSHGKIDRRALPDPAPGHLDPVAEYVAPRTPLEETLARVWAQVLELERVGVHDDFFDLGGHSLQSVQLVARLTAALDRQVSVKTVFEAPTVAAMAEVLEREPVGSQVPSHAHRNGDTQAALAGWLLQAETGVLPAHLTTEERPLEELFANGTLAPVDSVALSYFPSALLPFTGLDAATVIRDWCRDRPLVSGVRETPLGRVATVMIPRFDNQLYDDRSDLLVVLSDAVRFARRPGASTVSLTGLLPSASDYGRALAASLAGLDLPRITTGHATTTAAVVLAIRRALEEGGRTLAGEHVAFVGLGSVGVATLRLLLSCLPHPAALSLCDVYSKQEDLEALRREVTGSLGYRGAVRLLASRHTVPRELYGASLIVGATNVAEILDIDRVAPGTIIVDDSAPHVFRSDEALRRFHERRDILVTEGGVLAAPESLPILIHVPPGLEPWLKAALLSLVARSQPRYITGCVLSGLLSARFAHLAPTVGLVDRKTAVDHYEALGALGFEAAGLHLGDEPLDEAIIHEFRLRHGNGARNGHADLLGHL